MGTVMLFCTLGDCRIQDMCGTVCYMLQKSCGSGSVEEINNFTHTSLLIFYKEKEFFAYYGIYIIYMFYISNVFVFFFY